MRIIREVENGDAEEKCLSEYRREMEMLHQEKMSHVEELRQIHADINAVNIVYSVYFLLFNLFYNSRWKPLLNKLKKIGLDHSVWPTGYMKNIFH